MDRRHMAILCRGARPLGTVALDGWRFRINRAGYATLIPEAGSTAHGIVWRIAGNHERRLDHYEEVGAGLYRKDEIEVPGHGPALIYLATDERAGRPRPLYLDGVISAAKAAGLPAAYIAELARWRRGRR